VDSGVDPQSVLDEWPSTVGQIQAVPGSCVIRRLPVGKGEASPLDTCVALYLTSCRLIVKKLLLIQALSEALPFESSLVAE
jgi:hypothetical protein